jgi:hypothetical protein
MTCQAAVAGLATEGCYCVCCGKPAAVPPADWIAAAKSTGGFVRNERFSGGSDRVIPGTNRDKTRAFRRICGEPGREVAALRAEP